METQPEIRTGITRRLLWCFIAVIGCVSVYYVFVKGPKRSAINRWREQVLALASGEDAYTRFGFPTPPIMAAILYPFAIMPDRLGMAAWYVLKSAMFLFCSFQIVNGLRQALGKPVPESVVAVAWLSVANPTIADLLHGNINLFILFLVVAAFRAFQLSRDMLAGLVISLATACKVTPALMLVFFLWKRNWKLIISAAVGFFCWLILLPALWLGFEHNNNMLIRWGDLMLRPYVADGRVETDVRNQSAAGLFHRLTTRVEVSDEGAGRFAHNVSIVELDQSTAKWLWRGIGLFMLAVLGCSITPNSHHRNSPRVWHEFGLILVAMLLLSERSWKHHFVTLLPSYLVLWNSLACSTRRRWLHMGLLVGSIILTTIPSADLVEPIFGESTADRIQAFGPYTIAAALLFLAHLLRIREDKAVAPDSNPPASR